MNYKSKNYVHYEKYIILIIGWLCFIQIGNAQQSLRGKVMEYNEARRRNSSGRGNLTVANTSVEPLLTKMECLRFRK